MNTNIDNFDWQQYLNNYDDLKQSGIRTYKGALHHYLKNGQKEGRTFLPLHIVNNLQNFNWLQFATIFIGSQKYYILLLEKLGGAYKIPATRIDSSFKEL